MRYLRENKNIIDVIKAPYNVDNTGKIDCTKNLCKVFDDILMREVEGIWETWKKLEAIGKNNTYLGFEVRMEADFRYVVYPEFVPPSRIIYFPAGTYCTDRWSAAETAAAKTAAASPDANRDK